LFESIQFVAFKEWIAAAAIGIRATELF